MYIARVKFFVLNARIEHLIKSFTFLLEHLRVMYEFLFYVLSSHLVAIGMTFALKT